jgi:plastocyanin
MRAIIKNCCAALAQLANDRAILGAIVFGPIVGVLLAFGARAAEDSKASVTIDNFTFTKAELTVPMGTTVTWVNHDDIPHSVVESGKTFRSKALDTDDSFSFTFTTAGTFQYFCGLHPYMVGKVIVTP